MRGIILKITGKKCLVIDKNAIMREVRYPSEAMVGEEITFNVRSRNRLIGTSVTSLAAMLVVFFVVGYLMPTASVYVDINPSIMLEVNRYEQVLSVNGQNEDGTALINSINVKGMNLQEALLLVAQTAEEEGYFDRDSAAFTVTVISKNQQKAEALKSESQTLLTDFFLEEHLDVNLSVMGGDMNLKQQAEILGITPGKLNLLNKLVSENPELDRKDFVDSSVRDIMKTLQAEHAENKAADKEEKKNPANENSEKNPANENSEKNPANEVFQDNPANPNANENAQSNNGNENANPNANPNSQSNNGNTNPNENANPNSQSNNGNTNPNENANPNSQSNNGNENANPNSQSNNGNGNSKKDPSDENSET